MSTSLVLTPINGEPRIHDLLLGEKLGFANQYMIRKLIKRNEDKLLKFGIVSTVETIHRGAGRPTAEFYLNQKQALFICMKSETERAFEVQAEIVRVFDAYLKGELTPQHPSIPDDPLLLFAHAVQQIEAQHRARLDEHDMKLALLNQKVDMQGKHVTTLVKVITSHRQTPVINDRQIGLDLNPLAKPRRESQGGTHASPRAHQRREHYRTLLNGKRIRVRAHQVRQNKKGDTLQ